MQTLKDPSIANKFLTLPDAPFFLRHTVSMNYGGKVYAVLRGIEVASSTTDDAERALLIVYAICMLLGMYWYTRFWQKPEDIESYYAFSNENSEHVLNRCSNIGITLAAAVYYLLFAILFGLSYNTTTTPTCLALSLWNAWCCVNLLFAMPIYKR